jgi:hypothetical protein
MEPRHLYTVSWKQPYKIGVSLRETDALLEGFIEASIEHSDLAEAKRELERIMKL